MSLTKEQLFQKFIEGVNNLDDDDRDYLLDKIEESRWAVNTHYNRGVHILMDVVQYVVEQSYAPNNQKE